MSARITGADLDALRVAVSALDTPERRARYLAGDFPRAERVRDLGKRYRWDLFHAVGGWRVLSEDDTRTDAHIDTALRAIVGALR